LVLVTRFTIADDKNMYWRAQSFLTFNFQPSTFNLQKSSITLQLRPSVDHARSRDLTSTPPTPSLGKSDRCFQVPREFHR
jgi:hypothetical protein